MYIDIGVRGFEPLVLLSKNNALPPWLYSFFIKNNFLIELGRRGFEPLVEFNILLWFSRPTL